MDPQYKTIVALVKTAVSEFDPNAKVVLFGSRARGDARSDSDFDFLVLLNQPVDYTLRSKIWDRLYSIELETGCIISSLVENLQYWQMMENTPIFSEIKHDGIAV